MRKLSVFLLAAMLLLVGCSSEKTSTPPVGLPDANADEIVESASDAAVEAPAEDAVSAVDDAIIIDNKNSVLIYEDENCSFTVKWINEGGVTADIERKAEGLALGFYIEDVTMNGHTVKLSDLFTTLIYNDKTFRGMGIYGLYPNGNSGASTLFGPQSKKDIEGWESGEKLTEMSFTLCVINLDGSPDDEPIVSERFTLRKAN